MHQKIGRQVRPKRAELGSYRMMQTIEILVFEMPEILFLMALPTLTLLVTMKKIQYVFVVRASPTESVLSIVPDIASLAPSFLLQVHALAAPWPL